MNISQVSRTAILTLIARVVASEKENAIFNDPMAVLCLERLMAISSEEEMNRMIKWKKSMHTYTQGMQNRSLCEGGVSTGLLIFLFQIIQDAR